MRILLLEDSQAVRENLIDILELNGHQTLAAHDGATGLSYLHSEAVDLLVTDVNLPDTNGLEILQRVRQNTALRELCVLVITAERKTTIPADPSTRLLYKPFRVDDFMAVVDELLSQTPEK